MSDPEMVTGTVGLKLTMPDGAKRVVVVPHVWLIEAIEHTAPGREFHHESGVTFRMRDDGAIVVSDEIGGVHVMVPGAERDEALAGVKHRLWATWRKVIVLSETIDEDTLAAFAQRVAEWHRLIPVELHETACVQTEIDDDEGILSVFYRRPLTPEEQAEQAERDRHDDAAIEQHERKQLARLQAKYGTPREEQISPTAWKRAADSTACRRNRHDHLPAPDCERNRHDPRGNEERRLDCGAW